MFYNRAATTFFSDITPTSSRYRGSMEAHMDFQLKEQLSPAYHRDKKKEREGTDISSEKGTETSATVSPKPKAD